MNISKFFGVTNREAMRQVRLALGADALIISNKRVNGGVEIMAADPTELDSVDASTVAKPAGISTSHPVNNSNSAGTNNSADLQHMIGDLKGSLEARFEDLLWSKQLSNSGYAISLFQSLLRSGFSTSLLRAMLKVMPAQTSSRAALNWARSQLIKHLPVLEDESRLWQPGLVLALVGPTGVGKTTTIAKLAARFVHRFGAADLVLITTDTYRIGAHQQLKIYADLLHVPVHVVKTKAELHSLMQTIGPEKTVLIDNVGISQRDKHVAKQAALLAGAGRPVERLLVLNAASHGDTLDEVARVYNNDGGSRLLGCIISKTDESPKLGAALDVAIRYKLAIHFVSNGQKVPENLSVATAADLVDKAIYSQSADNLYAPSEADLSALLAVAQPEQSSQLKEQARKRDILLPQLLSNAGANIKLADLQAAVALLDKDQLLADSYDLWQAKANGTMQSAPALINHYRTVANSLAAGVKLVLHNRQSVASMGGTWLSSACFNNNGLPLASLSQQIGFNTAWYTVNGVMSGQPAAQEALFNQIQNENYLLEGDCLHVFDGTSLSLLRKLTDNNINFLAAVSARIKTYLNGEEYVLAAACNQLDLKPLQSHCFDYLLSPAGFKPGQVSWWYGTSAVQILSKGKFLPVNVFYLRAINNSSGKLLRSWYGIGNHEYGVGLLSKALILRQEYQSVLRAMEAQILVDDNAVLLDQAFFAAQSGLAAWHLSQSKPLLAAGKIAASMLGQTSISPKLAHSALLKLFTLKELLS